MSRPLVQFARDHVSDAVEVSGMAAIDPDVTARVRACAEALPDIPDDLLLRLPWELQQVMRDAMSFAREAQ